MDYQYNTQQAVNPAEIHARRQAGVFNFCDKLASVFTTYRFTASLMNIGDIFCFIFAGSAFLLSLLNMILSGFTSCGTFMGIFVILAALLSLGKRKVLPAAIAVSYLAYAGVFDFITTIVYMARYAKYGLVGAMTIIGFILSIAEVGLFVVATIFIWRAFAASLPYRAPQPRTVYVQQPAPAAAPVQQPAPSAAPVQQAAPVAAPVQQAAPVAAPVQQAAPAAAPVQQAAPAAAPAAPAQEAPAAKVCPQCGIQNDAGFAFCKGCGTKLN